jgi:hypothetical protein
MVTDFLRIPLLSFYEHEPSFSKSAGGLNFLTIRAIHLFPLLKTNRPTISHPAFGRRRHCRISRRGKMYIGEADIPRKCHGTTF